MDEGTGQQKNESGENVRADKPSMTPVSCKLKIRQKKKCRQNEPTFIFQVFKKKLLILAGKVRPLKHNTS